MSVNVSLGLGHRSGGRGERTESAGDAERLVVGRHSRGAGRRGGGRQTTALAGGGATCPSGSRATALIPPAMPHSAGPRPPPIIRAPPPSDPMLPPATIPFIPPRRPCCSTPSLCSSSSAQLRWKSGHTEDNAPVIRIFTASKSSPKRSITNASAG